MAGKAYETHRYSGQTREIRSEILANEGPLHIALNGESYVTTMRTDDGHDEELTRGLLYTEGIVSDPGAQFKFSEIVDPESKSLARLDVSVDPELIVVPVAGRRNQMATASCGICGTCDPADIELFGDPLGVVAEHEIESRAILENMDSMNRSQTTFHETGGTHAAGAYALDGTELVVREDIGRHNAVDKVIGFLLESGRLGEVVMLTVSGRVSYEIVSKAYRSQIPILAAVSAPSSMAVETSQAFGITLIGFCRENRISVYSHPERITAGGLVNE